MTSPNEQGCLFISSTSAYLIVDTSERQLTYNEPYRTENEKVQKFGNIPLWLDLDRDLVLKGAVTAIANCAVTLHGREETWNTDWCLIIKNCGKKQQAFKFCKNFWFSEVLPTHYTLSLLLDFWLLTISKVHPLINLLAAFMFLGTPMSPSFRTQMFSKNAFQSNFKLLKEAES